jgi:hypothetical protein
MLTVWPRRGRCRRDPWWFDAGDLAGTGASLRLHASAALVALVTLLLVAATATHADAAAAAERAKERAAVLDRGVVELDAFERSGVTLARNGSKDRR